ncbi:MAG: hypothetical protein AAGN66_14560 [Acidobacteriota bacterium]
MNLMSSKSTRYGMVFLVTLFALALAAAPAFARPCCQSCTQWPEPPDVLDYCWRNCYNCGGGGAECGGAQGSCQPGWACVGGYCVFQGGEPNFIDFGQEMTVVSAEPQCAPAPEMEEVDGYDAEPAEAEVAD